MKISYSVQWSNEIETYPQKKKKIGYNVFVMGKEDEWPKLEKISNFMSKETGYYWDGFSDDEGSFCAFFLESWDKDGVELLKQAYKKAKKEA